MDKFKELLMGDVYLTGGAAFLARFLFIALCGTVIAGVLHQLFGCGVA